MARRSDRRQASRSRSRSKGNSADWRQGARVDYASSESKSSKNPTRLAVDLPRSWARAHGMQLARDRSGIGYVQHQRSRALVGIKPPFGGQPERIAGVHADRTSRDAVLILLQERTSKPGTSSLLPRLNMVPSSHSRRSNSDAAQASGQHRDQSSEDLSFIGRMVRIDLGESSSRANSAPSAKSRARRRFPSNSNRRSAGHSPQWDIPHRSTHRHRSE
jgi:hypothetical protein